VDKVVLQLKFHHQFQFAGYYAAKSQGYYQQAGLDVEIRSANKSDHSIEQVFNDTANFGVGSSSLLLKRHNGLPVVVLAVIFQHSPYVLLTPRAENNQGLRDLINHKVMISAQAEELLAFLKKSGVPLYSLDFTEHTYNLDDLISGKVSAMSGYVTNQTNTLNSLGYEYDVYSTRSAGIDFYGDNLFTSEHEIAEHPERVAKFLAASLKGWEYALAHPKEIATIIKQQYKSTKSISDLLFEAQQMVDLIQPQLLQIGHMNPQRWQHIADIYASLNMLPANFNVGSLLYDPSAKRKLRVYLVLTAVFMIILLLFVYHIGRLITAKKSAVKEMRFMNTILKTQQQASIDGIITFDAGGRLISTNSQLKALWGLTDRTLSSQSPAQITFAMVKQIKNQQEFLQVARDLRNNTTEQHFAEMALTDGRIFERFSAPMIDEQQHFHGRFWSFRDITQRKQAEEKIWLQANFDSLTGLPNRFMLKDRISYEIKQAQRTQKLVVILFLDLDRFKEVNDTMGHETGDQLLIETAQRLKQCIREIDMVARLGGDEFTIVISGLEQSQVQAIERIANKVLYTLATPFQLNDEQVYISTSIGISLSPADGDNSELLLKHADQAMYHAKALGRNGFQYFTPSMHRNAVARIELINDLRQAVIQQQLFVVYQPIVCLSNMQIKKAEALIRWQHPQKGLINPTEFIPLAEETGIINEIGEWIFEQAVNQVARWQQQFDPEFQITVNTSPVQYHDDGLNVDKWHAKLSHNKLSGNAIVIEMTENLLMGTNSKILEKLESFRARGTQISLDDFGTGYSSLSYLKEFNIDYLKIDRSFVQHLTANSKEFALCQAIITMAHQLGMRVIAEGIETEEQCALLQGFNCDFGQGYLFSKPIVPEEFESLLSADKVISAP
jgi:diguanylate cyclase (GGDEF)-like protein/PAS domain S-box-containing protein